MITVAAQNGFTGTVAFACSGLPSQRNCSAPPLNGSGTTTLTVTTTAPSQVAPFGGPGLVGPARRVPLLILLSALSLAALLAARRRENYRPEFQWIAAAIFFVGLSLGVLSACGGGGGGGGGPMNPGTPLGTTTATVTATGTMGGSTVTHTIPVTITVQ